MKCNFYGQFTTAHENDNIYILVEIPDDQKNLKNRAKESKIMPWILLLIIIFAISEDTLEYIVGAILGGGYGILMIIAFVAVLYGIYKFFSDLWNGR